MTWNKSYSFAQLDCEPYNFILNQSQIAKIILFDQSSLVKTKNEMVFLYKPEGSEFLPVMDLFNYWDQNKNQISDNQCIFSMTIQDPKKQLLFKRVIKILYKIDISIPNAGILAPSHFSFVDIKLDDIKLLPGLVKNRLERRGLLGLVMNEQNILYWIDLEKMAYFFLKDMMR